jgi:hypothetical protein
LGAPNPWVPPTHGAANPWGPYPWGLPSFVGSSPLASLSRRTLGTSNFRQGWDDRQNLEKSRPGGRPAGWLFKKNLPFFFQNLPAFFKNLKKASRTTLTSGPPSFGGQALGPSLGAPRPGLVGNPPLTLATNHLKNANLQKSRFCSPPDICRGPIESPMKLTCEI